MSLALKTDLYQLTMAAGYVNRGLASKIVTCEAFARRLPSQRRFLVMAGTEEIRNALCNLRFSKEDIAYLREVPVLRDSWTSEFAEWLENFCFTGDMWAMAEGEVVFAGEPLIRITAPLPQAQLVETFILSILNHDIKIASKAARIVLASGGASLFEFGTRRTHHEAAVSVARSAYLAGFAGTSNVEAGRRFGIPIAGTMAHMWVMIYGDEEKAFREFTKCYKNATLLIDTYDTYEGAKRAMKMKGLKAVRIDSGDLRKDSWIVRHLLDEQGTGVKIIASGDLEEHSILSLLSKGTPIDGFGVGTKLAVSSDVPSLGIVYKVVYDETDSRPLMKKAGVKSTMPGRKQVFLDQRNGSWSHLVALDGAVQASDNLVPLMDCHLRRGKVVQDAPVGLEVARKYCNANLSSLASLPLEYDLSSLEPGKAVPVKPHESLLDMYKEAIKESGGARK